MADGFKNYSHAPTHLWVPGATYFLTGAILYHRHLLDSDLKKRMWIETFGNVLGQARWQCVAWVVLDNHYHAMLIAGEEGTNDIVKFVRRLHRCTSLQLNKTDKAPGRHVWYNYWDRYITFEKSYWPRINYIHHNPVKHGYVHCAAEYPHGSYHGSGDEWRETETSHPWDAIIEHDAF